MSSTSKPSFRVRPVSAFELRERVRLADTDAMGIIHFSAYARYIENVEIEFFRSIGFTLPELSAAGIVLPRVHVSYDFFIPALLDDEILVRLSIAGVGVHSLRMAIDVVRVADDATLAQSTVVSACMDRETRRSVALPDRLAAPLRALVPSSSDN